MSQFDFWCIWLAGWAFGVISMFAREVYLRLTGPRYIKVISASGRIVTINVGRDLELEEIMRSSK